MLTLSGRLSGLTSCSASWVRGSSAAGRVGRLSSPAVGRGVSNRRRMVRRVPAEWKALASASRCSDCPGRARVRYVDGAWQVTLTHAAGCPALALAGSMLHRDAAKSVGLAAEKTGKRLTYEVASDRDGIVRSGVVTGR